MADLRIMSDGTRIGTLVELFAGDASGVRVRSGKATWRVDPDATPSELDVTVFGVELGLATFPTEALVAELERRNVDVPF